MRPKELFVELRDRMVSRHRLEEGYQNMSAALKVPKNTVTSIILKWKKFGTTKTLPRAGRPAKLSNRGRRAFVKDVTKNSMVTLTELGEPSLQHSTNQAIMVEWPDRSHSSVKGT
jgi:transposase